MREFVATCPILVAGCILSLLSSAPALAKGQGADDKAATQPPPFRLRHEPAPQAETASAPAQQAALQATLSKDGKFPPFRAPAAPPTETVAAAAKEAPAPEGTKTKFPPWRSRDGELASEVVAAAAPPPPPPPAVVPPSATGPEQAQAAGSGPQGLDFNLLPEGAGSTAESKGPLSAQSLKIERQIRLRRPMLQAHQALGFITLGALAATMIVGQLAYVDQYTSGDYTGRYDGAHLGLGITSSVLFAATGLLAVIAPNPYPKPWRLDSAAVHKISMIAATAGMVAQLVLGPIVASREGKLDQPSWALAHLVTGWTTFGLFATGVVAYVF